MWFRAPLLLLVLASAYPQTSNRGYYRFPAIYGQTIVFTSEGDLWEVPIEGGTARRLTTHPGEETRAAFSPGRADHRVFGELRGAHRGLYHARHRRPAHTPNLRGQRKRRRLDTRWQDSLRHAALLHAARHPTGDHRFRQPRGTGPAQPGCPGELRRHRRDPLLHPPPLPGQLCETIPGRHCAEYLEVRGRPRSHAR